MYFTKASGIACVLVTLQIYSVGQVFGTVTVPVTPNLPQANSTRSEETYHGDGTENLLAKIYDSCDTQQLMAHLIMKETKERIAIQVESERRIKELENSTTFLENQLFALQEQVRQREQTVTPVVAFSARVSNHLNNLQPKQTIVFGSVFTNVGSAYDANSGKFRSPVSGLYQFYVGILSKPGYRIETELVVNGENRLLIYASSGGNHHGSLGSNTVILELQKDDLVWVQLYHSFGEYVHCCWSTFSGHLLNAS